MTRLQQQGKRLANKDEEESFNVSKTIQLDFDSRGANAIKKTKRVNVESGNKKRSFKLSIFFLLLQFFSILLSYVIVVKDLLYYQTDLTITTDIGILHDLNMLIQLDNFIFHVNLLLTQNLILSSNPESYRESVVGNLGFLSGYISEDDTLQYSNSNYKSMWNTLYYQNVCNLLNGVDSFT